MIGKIKRNLVVAIFFMGVVIPISIMLIGQNLDVAAAQPAEKFLVFQPFVLGAADPPISATPSATASSMPPMTSTPTASPIPTMTATWTPTATPADFPSATESPTPTASPSATASPTLTASPSATASPTLTAPPLVTATPTPTPTATAVHQVDWWDVNWRYRLPFSLGSGDHPRQDKTAEFSIDFSSLLSVAGDGEALEISSLRLIEVSAEGALIDDAVPFQFDPDPDFDPLTQAKGQMVVLLAGQTAAQTQRYYQLYFESSAAGPFPSVEVSSLVTLTDGVMDEGLESYLIEARNASYFFDKQGGGFSSLIDQSGQDWINYQSLPGSAGAFRGIPNLVTPADGGYFHPGAQGAVSELLSVGPLKVMFRSQVLNQESAVLWDGTWEIYADYARFTINQAAAKYWFQFEGTPGGALDLDSDILIFADGSAISFNEKFLAPIVDPPWVYFADFYADRSLFMLQHKPDFLDDYAFQMNEEMVVFGMGRRNSKALMSQVPRQFTIGLVDTLDVLTVSQVVEDAWVPLDIELEALQILGS